MSEDTKVVKGAGRLSSRISGMRALLAPAVLIPVIGEMLKESTLRRFDEEVDPDGNPWAPHAESTLKRRRTKPVAKNDKILVNQSDLRRAIDVIRGGAGSTFSNTGAGLRIGIRADAINEAGKEIAIYASANNKGTGHVPARRFLGISTQDVALVSAFLQGRGDNAVDKEFE